MAELLRKRRVFMREAKNFFSEESLDAEWVELMQLAKNLGLSIEDVKEFLAENKVSNPA